MVTVLTALFLIGLGLSLTGGVIGLVQAFQTNVVWGFLYLFVPFASLVFVSKFWCRKWVRNSLFLTLGGVVSFIAAALVSPSALQQAGVYSGAPNWDASAWEDGDCEECGVEDSTVEYEDETIPVDSQLIEGTSATQAQLDAYFQSALDLAMAAAARTQTASTAQDCLLVANLWQDEIAILDSIPESDPNHAMAEAKAAEYRNNLDYAQSQVDR